MDGWMGEMLGLKDCLAQFKKTFQSIEKVKLCVLPVYVFLISETLNDMVE
jgi:hypothetical protein